MNRNERISNKQNSFMQGGSTVARLVPYEEKEMPKKRKLTDAQALELFEMVRKGRTTDTIAKHFGIAKSTVNTYYRRVLSDRGKNAGSPRLVVVRGMDRLTFDVDKGYVGTFRLDGEMVEECVFEAREDAEAIIQYDEWRERMSAEMEFMKRIERKGDEPVDEDAAYIATWDAASVANILRDYNDGRLLRDVDRDADVAIAVEERDERIVELEEKLAKRDVQKAYGTPVGTVYAVIAIKPKIKCYGAYQDMDRAFSELDRLNDVAGMLGVDGAFEVHEMEWR